MPYTTPAALEASFGEQEILGLADRNRDGVADAGVIEAAIAEADAIINPYLRTRFALPLPEVPDLIGRCARVIVRYALSDDHAPDRVKEDYKQAIRWLEQIRDGALDVGLTPSGADIAATGGGPRHDAGRDAFRRDALDAWTGDGEC